MVFRICYYDVAMNAHGVVLFNVVLLYMLKYYQTRKEIIMDVEQWMTKAEYCIKNKVKAGNTFEVRKLFEAVEWEELSKGERIQFGRDFSNAVKEGRFPNVERTQKAQNNHAQYTKMRE